MIMQDAKVNTVKITDEETFNFERIKIYNNFSLNIKY